MSKKHNSLFIIHYSTWSFSLVEVVLAIAIFMILAVTGVTTILHSFSVNKLGEEHTYADFYAGEGIEAVRSIKNQGWSNLSPGAQTRGLTDTNGYWEFSGTEDIKDKYTRRVTVSPVERDINGNIVESGGVVDTDTLKITLTINWNYSGSRDDSIVREIYLTNFRKSIGGDALIVYGDASITPKQRNYANSSDLFDNENDLFTSAAGMNFVMRTSPIKKEAIAGLVTSGGELRVFCYDGSLWSEEWSGNVGGNGTTKRFDVSYETNSGDAIVVYNNNNSNLLGYKTKSGSVSCGSGNWNSGTYTPLKTSGVVHWVKMAWDRRTSSDLITAIWADANSDLSAAVWTGNTWGNEPSAVSESSLEIVSASQDVDDFDVEYESLSGDVMLVWANSAGGNGTNGVRYRTCAGGSSSCTWGAVTTPPTWSDDATNLDISANPLTDEMVFASIGNSGCDLQMGYWNGNSWTNVANTDVSSVGPVAGARLVATGWLISDGTARSVVVYQDSTNNACSTTNGVRNIGWYTGSGGSFSLQPDFTPSPLFAGPQKWYEMFSDPINTDRLMLILSDNANDLYAKRLTMTAAPVFTWSNSDGGVAIEDTLQQAISSPFGFAYWKL